MHTQLSLAKTITLACGGALLMMGVVCWRCSACLARCRPRPQPRSNP